jgi:hypothetical protein
MRSPREITLANHLSALSLLRLSESVWWRRVTKCSGVALLPSDGGLRY